MKESRYLEGALSTPYTSIATATYSQRNYALREILEAIQKAGIVGQPELGGRWEDLAGEEAAGEGKIPRTYSLLHFLILNSILSLSP